MNRRLPPDPTDYERERAEELADEYERMREMDRNAIMDKIVELGGVRSRRAGFLARVRDEMTVHAQALGRLDAQAEKWELGVAAVEEAIEDLTMQLEEYPLDMSPTGEGDESPESLGELGYSVQ